MNKEYMFSLGKELEKKVNSSIKDQLDLIRLCLETSRAILTEYSDTKEVYFEDDEGFRIVYPNRQIGRKLQRVFFYNRYENVNGKSMFTIQTFVYPLKLEKAQDKFVIFGDFPKVGKVEFNAGVISRLVTLINIIKKDEQSWGDTWVEELMELLHGKDDVIKTDLLFYIVNEFLTFDFGYLRFDNDPKHEGENHPLYHIDCHLDSRATYKIGLDAEMNISKFLDLIDNGSSVRYLKNK